MTCIETQSEHDQCSGGGAPPLRRNRQSVVDPASLGLDKAKHDPVRPPKEKTKGPVRYRMVTDKAGLGQVMALGDLQRDLAIHLLTNPRHLVVHERPHVLTRYAVDDDGRIAKFEHIPSFGISFDDGSVCFVDVRRAPATEAQRAGDELLAEAYREHGALYRCLDGSVVTARPRLPNLKRIREVADGRDRDAILAVRSALGGVELPVTIREVLASVDLPIDPRLDFGDGQYDRGLSAIFHLVLRGEVELDLARLIDCDTLVREVTDPTTRR